MPADEMRFSDAELIQLREEFEEHKELQEERWAHLAAMVEKNTAATERLADSVQSIARSTEGVVQLYTDFKGAARVGVGVRKFLTWLISLGAGGAALASAILYIIERMGPPA